MLRLFHKHNKCYQNKKKHLKTNIITMVSYTVSSYKCKRYKKDITKKFLSLKYPSTGIKLCSQFSFEEGQVRVYFTATRL